MQTNILSEILDSIITMLLTLGGILMTIGTVLSSFMLSKRDSLRFYSEEKKRGVQDHFIERAILVESHFIKQTQSHLKKCLLLLSLICCLLIIDYIFKICSIFDSVFLILIEVCSTIVIVLSWGYLIHQMFLLWKECKIVVKK